MKLSMTEKERLLPNLVEDGWLAEVPGQRGSYSIGVRSLLGLASLRAKGVEHACTTSLTQASN